MSTIVIASSIWFGYELTTYIIKNEFDFMARVSMAIPLGFTVESLYYYASSIFFPLSLVNIIAGALIFGIISLIIHISNRRYFPSLVISMSYMEAASVIISAIFCIFVSNKFNIYEGHFSAGASYADLPFHMNIVSSFAYGVNKNRSSLYDSWSTFQSGTPLAYPILHDFYLAVLIACDDISLPTALQLTSALLLISFIYLFYSVSLAFTNDRIVASLSSPTFLTLAGLGWTLIFYQDLSWERWKNWTGHLALGIEATWMQPLVHVLIPQRSALFSLPLCLSTILCFFKGVKDYKLSFFVLSGICTGLLPQLQVHSFVAMAQFAIATAALFLEKKKFWKQFRSWSLYGAMSVGIGLPLTVPFWRRTIESRGFISFLPLWSDGIYGPMKFPLVEVWWKALGPFGYVMIIFGWVSANGWQLRFWGAAQFVWLTTSFIRYQPWAMDNLKLIFAVWLPIAVPFVTQFYVKTWRIAKWRWMKAAIAFMILQNTFSSMFCWKVELFMEKVFLRDEEYNCGNWIAENTPVSSIFLSYSERFSPPSSIGGRQIYNGFISWVLQHGVETPERELMTNKMLSDKENPKLFAYEGVGYAVTRVNDSSLTFPLSSKNAWWEIAYKDSTYTIYKLINCMVNGSTLDRRRNRLW